LIAFSNHSFYDGKLVLFPSPDHESGLRFTKVSNGKFLSRTNIEEANVIARAVRAHLLNRPDETVGVVAMSAEQRDQIECAVEDLAKSDPVFGEAIEKDQNKFESLFVKNLENVQGDERDVIMISMTYGPDARGTVMQRFGPINSDLGWRRLNVLFTRSRKRMHVFSSMGSDDIRVSERSRRGVRELKNFLTFAETGLLHESGIETDRPPDSDFEIAVADALRHQYGYECEPQVGAAGYFIDLAVRDPGNPSKFLMGIECDGATYHSAKSVRDRDRLRQQVLENLGWKIRRIWSTDWFKDPARTIREIVQELDDLKTCGTVDEDEASDSEFIESIDEVTQEPVEQMEVEFSEGRSLRETLEQFGTAVIRKQCPNTPEERRLLRPSMVEALVEFLPTNTWEFQENIPPYLRTATAAEEGRFLPSVFELIQSYV
jgi:very-short-patch-repair endonuclease